MTPRPLYLSSYHLVSLFLLSKKPQKGCLDSLSAIHLTCPYSNQGSPPSHSTKLLSGHQAAPSSQILGAIISPHPKCLELSAVPALLLPLTLSSLGLRFSSGPHLPDLPTLAAGPKCTAQRPPMFSVYSTPQVVLPRPKKLMTFTHSLLNLSIGLIYQIALVKHLGVIIRSLSLTSHIQTITI